MRSLLQKLRAPIDNSSLTFFRISFGLIMLVEVYRYFAHGKIERYFIQPDFHFKFYGFDWVKPLTGEGMYILFLILGVLSIFIALGLFYRISMGLFFLGFCWVFLIEQAIYLNHFYLICLISFLMTLLPLHQSFSLDSKRNPQDYSPTTPAWALWTLRLELAIVYFYAAVAKMNPDWLTAKPMDRWLAERSHYPLVGPLFEKIETAYVFSYGGLLFDLLIVPLLLWKKTRIPAFVCAVFFHVTNAILFNIGIFPWLMIPATLLFFPPDWPKTFFLFKRPLASSNTRYTGSSRNFPAPIAGVLGIFFVIQILLPLRHFLYPGVVHWTEEGHRFAWHMKLRSKRGKALFSIHDLKNGNTWEVDPRYHLSRRQTRKMTTRPDMILQFAHHLGEQKRQEGYDDIAVYVNAKVSLNGRPKQPLIDSKVNLLDIPRSLKHGSWILPLRSSKK